MKTKRTRRITSRQLEPAIGVLGDVSTSCEKLDGRDRDDISRVIAILDELSAAGGLTITLSAGQYEELA